VLTPPPPPGIAGDMPADRSSRTTQENVAGGSTPAWHHQNP